MTPALGLYTCKIMKKIKEIILKLVANDRSDKRFRLTSKFCPLGMSAPDLRLSAPDLHLYTFIKS